METEAFSAYVNASPSLSCGDVVPVTVMHHVRRAAGGEGEAGKQDGGSQRGEAQKKKK